MKDKKLSYIKRKMSLVIVAVLAAALMAVMQLLRLIVISGMMGGNDD